MATGGYTVDEKNPEKLKVRRDPLVLGVSDLRNDELACGSCNTPATKFKCKYFCDECNVFICQKCQYHVRLADDYDDYDVHTTEVTVGAYAKSVAENTKKRLEEEMLLCENIKNAKQEYREYLEHSIDECKRGKEILQKAINEINYDLRRIHEVEKSLHIHLDELKSAYNNRDAISLIRKRRNWTKYGSELKEIEKSYEPCLRLTRHGKVINVYPKVELDRYCVFDGITGQALRPEKVKRAWILHAGELYVYRGEFEFWNYYYQSQIRPFVNLADNNEDILVFLMQISGFVGQWSRNNLEMSGEPYMNGTNTDKHGNRFILIKQKNAIDVHIRSHVARVDLPVDGPSEYFSPIILCVDSERELLCVYTANTNYYEEQVYVYKIRYTFKPPTESTETSSDEEELNVK